MQRNCDWLIKVTGGTFVGSPVNRHIVVRGVSTDSRTLKPDQLYIPLCGANFDGHDFLEQAIQQGAVATLWQADREIPLDKDLAFIVVSDPLLALQQMASAYRKELTQLKVIGVTGSNGKTTTKDLIAAVLAIKYRTHKTRGNLNNHIGVPLTLLSIKEDTEMAVVEMGMNHAGEISVLSELAQPDVVVITNIGESHLEFLGSREGIADAKLEIREGLRADGVIIFNGDEPLLRERLSADRHQQICLGFDLENDIIPCDVKLNGLEHSTFGIVGSDTLFSIPLIGEHNIQNALFAIAVGRLVNMSDDQISVGFHHPQMTGMRLEVNSAENGMKIINDTYNSSPTSVRGAVDLLLKIEFPMEKWVLLGDMNELGLEEEKYHQEIGEYVARSEISRIYTIGDRGKRISEGAQKMNHDSNRIIRHFLSDAEAIQVLRREGHERVLLLVKASRSLALENIVTGIVKGVEETDG